MDFDPRITYDGSKYGSTYGWHCNFHFGYGHDIIDEDAANERSCLQVLPLLIDKADAEIHDLEDELAIIECQLKWAESGHLIDPFEIFCDAFKRRIEYLTSSIKSSRNADGLITDHEIDTTFELQSPAERICDIIYALIRPDLPELDDKFGDFSKFSLSIKPSTVGFGEKITLPLETKDKIGKSEPPPNVKTSQQACSASDVQARLQFPAEMNRRSEAGIEEDMIYANPFQGKRRKRACRQVDQTKSPKVKVSNSGALSGRGRGRVRGRGRERLSSQTSACLTEVPDSKAASNSANP